MEKMVMLTEKEFEELQYEKKRLINTCLKLKRERDDAYMDCMVKQQRIQNLWNILNRPAIEESVSKHDDDFYSWCAEKANEYEEKDFADWTLSRAKFYNNGISNLCEKMGVSEEELYENRKYDFGVKFWSTSSINKGIYRQCENEDIDVLLTEGWSSLGHHWILSKAADDVWNRYQETKNKKYWHLWMTFIQMKEEAQKAIKEDEYGDYYR